MQNSTKRNMRARRNGPASGPLSGRAKRSERKSSGPARVRLTDAKGNYERYMALARAAASTGDEIEIENYYQHAEHYFRLMRAQVV